MKHAIVLLTLCLSTICGAAEGIKPGLGMWVWPQAAFDTEAARDKLLAFCAEEEIIHLDQHVGIEKGDAACAIKNAEALTALIVAAQKQGVTVNALRGAPKMFFSRNHPKTLDELRAIIAFDQRLPATAHLAGVKYDVEPYGTEQWKAGGEQRVTVMQDYLAFLQKAKALLQEEAPYLELSVDVPMWWDSPQFTVEFAGQKKLMVHHVQDLTDYLGIMSYRPSAQQVLKVIREELDYASTINKTICPGLETGKLEGKESWISFWGQPQSDFRQAVGELQQTLSGNKAVRCIMLHHYNSLVDYLGDTHDLKKGDANR